MQAGFTVLAHLPRVRIEQDIPIDADFRLWRTPFETWNTLTQGAFEDRARDYEVAAPTFLNFDVTDDIPCERAEHSRGVAETKADDAYQMLAAFGLHGVANMLHALWRALSLAAPSPVIPNPRLSQAFVVLDDGFAFRLGETVTGTLRVQGAADHELILQQAPPGPALTPAQVQAALALLGGPAQQAAAEPDIAAAIEALLQTADPVLSDIERLTLAVMALEALLLPEVRTGLKRTFAQRLSALIGGGQADAVHAIGRALYAVRSATVHGEGEEEAAVSAGTARVALAGAIRAMIALVAAGEQVAAVREQLDAGPVPGTEPVDLAAALAPEPPLLSACPTRQAATASPNALVAPEGTVMLWAPLIGLGTRETVKFSDRAGAPIVMALSGEEILSLVDKDTRRDFAATLYQVPEQIAGLTWGFALAGNPAAAANPEPVLERQRDLGVLALRLAGFGGFADPELFGLAAFRETLRLRQPSIYQQSMLMRLRRAPEAGIEPSAQATLDPAWALLADYEAGRRHRAVELALMLFRRAFFTDLFDASAQAMLIFACLETLTGRFTRPDAQFSTEWAVVAAAKAQAPEAAEWFRAQGRAYRNGVAHGSIAPAADAPEHATLRTLLRHLLASYLEAWNAAPRAGEDSPAALHREWLKQRG